MSETTDSEIDIRGSHEFHRSRALNGGHSMTSLQKISVAITGTLERFFYRWGLLVGSNPKKTIAFSLLFTAICGVGLLNFSMENRPDRLWIPRNSEFAQNTEWLRKNFPSPIRTNFAIIKADNVMTPEVLRVILDIHEKVKEIQVHEGKRWEDICFKLPVTNFLSRRRRRRSTELSESERNHSQPFLANLGSFDEAFEDEFFKTGIQVNPSGGVTGLSEYFQVPDEFYCSIVEELDDACWEVNPAEMWSFKKDLIHNLTQEDIIHVLNHEMTSPIFGRQVDYKLEFGGNIVRNEKGEVVSAESVQLRWVVGINQTQLREGKAKSDQTGEIVDSYCLEWELKWIDLMKNISLEAATSGVKVFYVNSQSWMQISEATIFDDGLTLAVGFVIMFCYVGTMLGRFNLVEQRPYLTMAGLSCVGLSVVVSYGICSLCQLVYGPVNKILPFLLLGIGIDDMFVIMQCWNNLFPNPKSHQNLGIPERMGMAMKHAGVSITVTSLTDVAAFAVGSSTILPGLKIFCIYAAVGIVAVFLFQATYFVAWFALDQKRVEERRNAFFPWIKYTESEFIPNTNKGQSFGSTFFENIISKVLFTKVAKVCVILSTFSILGVTIYGNMLLPQKFDPMWFLPDDSYMSQFVQQRDVLYPGTGYPAFLVANEVNWTDSLGKFEKVLDKLEGSGAAYKLENWFQDFKQYTATNFQTEVDHGLTTSQFRKYMGKFLFSPNGSKYRAYFKVNGNFTCGGAVPPIKTALLPFRFKKFSGPEEHIPQLRNVKSLMRNSNISFNSESGKFFVFGIGLVTWETDEIIDAELYRNVALSLMCVLVTTFFLLANFRVCILCGVCVIFTLTNVGGFMYFWGLTIDTVSCINIVLGIGLCVDYSLHIALAFMTCTGSRDARAKQALRNIGGAVLNGGFSTFLAIILLANSKSHAFQSFFKIFTLVIVFGLYHGLVFLPVLLSICGPDPYPFAYDRDEELYGIDGKKGSPAKIVELQSLRVVDFVQVEKNGKEKSSSEPFLLAGDRIVIDRDNQKSPQ